MLLDRRAYFIKERVAFVKLTDTYDIMDPETGAPIGVAKEEPPGWAKFARLVVNKHFLPTAVNVYEDEASEARNAIVIVQHQGRACLDGEAAYFVLFQLLVLVDLAFQGRRIHHLLD